MTDEFGRQLVVARERVREIAEQDPSAPAARSADDFPISNAIPPNATPAASFVARSILALARDGAAVVEDAPRCVVQFSARAWRVRWPWRLLTTRHLTRAGTDGSSHSAFVGHAPKMASCEFPMSPIDQRRHTAPYGSARRFSHLCEENSVGIRSLIFPFTVGSWVDVSQRSFSPRSPLYTLLRSFWGMPQIAQLVLGGKMISEQTYSQSPAIVTTHQRTRSSSWLERSNTVSICAHAQQRGGAEALVRLA